MHSSSTFLGAREARFFVTKFPPDFNVDYHDDDDDDDDENDDDENEDEEKEEEEGEDNDHDNDDNEVLTCAENSLALCRGGRNRQDLLRHLGQNRQD